MSRSPGLQGMRQQGAGVRQGDHRKGSPFLSFAPLRSSCYRCKSFLTTLSRSAWHSTSGKDSCLLRPGSSFRQGCSSEQPFGAQAFGSRTPGAQGCVQRRRAQADRDVFRVPCGLGSAAPTANAIKWPQRLPTPLLTVSWICLRIAGATHHSKMKRR